MTTVIEGHVDAIKSYLIFVTVSMYVLRRTYLLQYVA